MSDQSLQDVLDSYPDPIAAMRDLEVVDKPTPSGRPRPAEYTNWLEEQLSWKETCYLGDWSFMPDLRVQGPDALELFRDLTVNSFVDFPIGKAKHAVQCNQDGKVIGDGILFRYDDDQYHTQHLAAWPMYNAEIGDYDVTAEIHDTFIYQLQGPTSLAVLEAAADTSMRELGFMNIDTIEIAGREVIVLRQGMSGEVGFELQGPEQYGDEVWDAIVEAGQDHGLRRLGHRTHMINHLEMGFSTRGHHYLPAIFEEDMRGYREWLDADNAAEAKFTIAGSFDAEDISAWYRSPVELGWERNIKFDHDFVGREALEAEVENPERTKVTLRWDSDDVVEVYASLFEDGPHNRFMDIPYQKYRAIEANTVLKDGEPVGVATGRGYSYYFREMLSLSTIDVEYSEPGTEVTVLWGEGGEPSNPKIEPHVQKEIKATVAPSPYKEDKRRTDLQTTGRD